jgi:hypothetical protein
MGENKKNIEDILEKLTLVTEAAQDIFPEGKTILIYELDNVDFKKMQENFRKIDINKLRFKIEISGNEIVFINNKIYEEEEVKEEVKKEVKVGFWKRLFSNIGSKSSIKR